MKVLKDLFKIYSPSGDERKMRKFVKRYARQVPGVVYECDGVGNVYITRGAGVNYPCIVAHLDQVQDVYPDDYTILEDAHTIKAFSPSRREWCGLGADDKVGIWIALKMLQKHAVIKIALFSSEEIGCVGSSRANVHFFDNCRFVVQCDRRGYGDIVTNIMGVQLCSDEFLAATNYANFGYAPSNGAMSDVWALRDAGVKCSCVNLSCGYYSPHTEEEFIIKNDVINCLNFVDHIISNCTDVYPAPADADDFSHYYRVGGASDWDTYAAEWDAAVDDIGTMINDIGTMPTADELYNEYNLIYPTLQLGDYVDILNFYKN